MNIQNLIKNKILIFLIILAVLPTLSLFNPGLPITHDGQDHVARIANFYQSLSEGNLIPRWAPNLNWGYGHPILEFLYPFPSYVASLFHFAGFSLVDSTKIVFGLGMVLSLFFMYLWLSQFLSKYSSLFGAVLYTYAPYRFVETYVRGDIGENLAFAFIPLVLYFTYKFYKKNDYKFTILGGISLALLILSHNAISLMFMPFILAYCLYLIWLSKFNKYLIRNTLFVILIGFTLSMFFWIPGLLEGKYTLRNIVTKGTYINSFPIFERFIYSKWNYGGSQELSLQFGLFQWIAILLSPLTIYLSQKNKHIFYLSIILIVFGFLSIFIMLPISNFIWEKVMLLQNFQFPWRFISIIIFVTAVLGAFLFDQIKEKQKLLVFIVCTMLILFLEKDYMKPKAYLNKPESFYTSIYNSTTDTGESAPIWSVRFMEKRPNAHLEVIDGSATIKELQRKSIYHKYEINVLQKTLFRENTLYFPGWEIKANGVPLKIEFQNMTYRGVMLFNLPKGNYIVEAKYSETKLRALVDVISVVALFNILGFGFFRFVKYSFVKNKPITLKRLKN